jgi:hypothetical protein
LETGYKFENGNIVRTESYKRIVLAGANQEHQRAAKSESILLPARLNFRPGITEGVDEDVYDAWVAAHKDSNIVKNKLIWKAKNKTEALAIAQADERKIGFEPLDRKKLPQVKAFDAEDDGSKAA